MSRRLTGSIAVAALICSTAGAQVNDGFESYADGPLAPQNGWEMWYSGGGNGDVISTNAHGGSKSLRASAGTDLIKRFNISGGQWDCSFWTYMPQGALDAYFIMMNQYGDAAIDNWSVQIRFGGIDGMIESQFDGAMVPLLFDQWVEVRLEIDLDGDLVNSFYNGQPLGVNLSWSNNVSAGGIPTIGCIDLYSQTADGFLYDDLVLEAGGTTCIGDLDSDGDVDLQDLANLLAHFGGPGGGLPTGDIDGDGDVDLQDLANLLAHFGVSC